MLLGWGNSIGVVKRSDQISKELEKPKKLKRVWKRNRSCGWVKGSRQEHSKKLEAMGVYQWVSDREKGAVKSGEVHADDKHPEWYKQLGVEAELRAWNSVRITEDCISIQELSLDVLVERAVAQLYMWVSPIRWKERNTIMSKYRLLEVKRVLKSSRYTSYYMSNHFIILCCILLGVQIHAPYILCTSTFFACFPSPALPGLLQCQCLCLCIFFFMQPGPASLTSLLGVVHEHHSRWGKRWKQYLCFSSNKSRELRQALPNVQLSRTVYMYPFSSFFLPVPILELSVCLANLHMCKWIPKGLQWREGE